MERLLSDLLAYTQLNLDAGDFAEPVDLNMVVRKVIENLKAAIEENHAAVTSTDLPAVRGREGYFIQLFQNLVENSIKYRGERPPTVHISAERTGTVWRVAVADNGMGIEPEYREQIFEVFKRLHGNQVSGTGFGLAICRRVVERCGGYIWVESEIGKGSTFYFTVPAIEEAAS